MRIINVINQQSGTWPMECIRYKMLKIYLNLNIKEESARDCIIASLSKNFKFICVKAEFIFIKIR